MGKISSCDANSNELNFEILGPPTPLGCRGATPPELGAAETRAARGASCASTANYDRAPIFKLYSDV
ncbi:hypothetical protein EVAR_69123_1 [Eumeta japonica]|uniref:Uncharacterized protein n=1 Tax=Eumeta variegata TaxID=151549 RepID=A0A4C1SBU0_EUMVA|nr:hypothetical protein EVAR_69123_1 [Eumeta japonica]